MRGALTGPLSPPMRTKKGDGEMRESLKSIRNISFVALLGASCLAAPAHAGGKIEIGENQWVSIGGGLRSSLTVTENASPDGSAETDIGIDSVRLYVNAGITEKLSIEFNTEFDGDDDIHLLDGVMKYAHSDELNVWVGRFLPPSDRSNLSGPNFMGQYNFPNVQAYPAIFAGRDNGVAVWGQTGGGKFKYQFGAFEGCSGSAACASPSNDSDSLLYAGRLVMNFWDPEPGYYNASDYYGAKDILAIGLVAQYQSDATGLVGDEGDFFAWNADFLMQKKLTNDGVFTLEGAYYDYDTDGKFTPIAEGEGYFGLVSYLFPNEIGVGRIQPSFRYQSFERDDLVPDTKTYDMALNYIVDGHNARFHLVYQIIDTEGVGSNGQFLAGIQLQF